MVGRHRPQIRSGQHDADARRARADALLLHKQKQAAEEKTAVAAAELARVLHLDPSTISGVVQRLVAKRLLCRDRDEVDRRVARLRLTPAGDRLNRPSKIGTIESAIRAMLGHLPEPKVRAAMDVLEQLSQTLIARR